MSLTIWFNGTYTPAATLRLRQGVGKHRLIESAFPDTVAGRPGHTDPALAEADLGFGQPPVGDLLRSPRWRWMHISSAGYSRYDVVEVREALRARGAIVTNSSAVYADPCAQHVLAMMLALGRNLLPAYRWQLGDHSWRSAELRYTSQRLTGATILLLGFGAIGRRLTELLAPFRCTIYAVRRQTRSEPGVRVIPEAELTRVLALADHVVNILPENEATGDGSMPAGSGAVGPASGSTTSAAARQWTRRRCSKRCARAGSAPLISTLPRSSRCRRPIRSGRHRIVTSRRISPAGGRIRTRRWWSIFSPIWTRLSAASPWRTG